MNKKTTIIGVGNCGGQVTYLGEKNYSELFDTIYINTSEADLSTLKTENELKFKIGDKDEVEGSGKNRTKMKEYLKEDISDILSNKKVQDIVVNNKYCFIIASAAGGTGSGAAPVLQYFMQQMFPDTHFIIVGVLPHINASLGEHGNTLEFLKEIYDVLGESTTYMLYDNETTRDYPPTRALEIVNENIIEDIRVLTGVDNFATPYESIDEADMESIITTPGRLLVVRLSKNVTEKMMEDNNLDDMIIKAIKKSCHVETDRNKRVVRLGIITYFNEAVNKLYTTKFDKLCEFIGTPVETFNHNAVNTKDESFNFIYMIASGLSPINDRVKKIQDKVNKLKNALATDESSKYILSGDSTSYEELANRRHENTRANQAETLNVNDVFKKFM